MNYDMKQSGERIRQLRIQNGYTQERLTDALKIDQSFLSRIESGSKGCSVVLFIKLLSRGNLRFDSLRDRIMELCSIPFLLTKSSPASFKSLLAGFE